MPSDEWIDSGNYAKHVEMVKKCNAMTSEEIDKLIAEGECPYNPEWMKPGVPLGMFHCELCGEMVLAGMKHPREPDEE